MKLGLNFQKTNKTRSGIRSAFLSVFILCLLMVSMQVHACKMPRWSPESFVPKVPSIVVAEIVSKKIKQKAVEILTFKTLDILKGKAPSLFYVARNRIEDYVDACRHVMNPKWVRPMKAGDKWILFGEFSTVDKSFSPLTESLLYDEEYHNEILQFVAEIEKNREGQRY